MKFERMKKNYLNILAMIALLAITACSEDNPAPELTQLSEIDDATAEAYADYVEGDVNELVIDLMDGIRLERSGGEAATDQPRYRPFGGKFTCGVIEIDLNAQEIMIDFGEGCESADGVTRSGKIFISYSDKRHIPGAVITTTFENYVVNNIGIDGTRTLRNVSNATERQRAFEITIEGGQITFPDGSTRTFAGTRTRTWSIEESSDEVTLTVTGSMSGVNRNGAQFVNSIDEPLVYKKSCRQVGTKVAISGVRSLTRNDQTLMIDYGDGACDNVVVITKPNGETQEIVIEGRRRG
jgi:hypothetical protein